MTLHSALPYQLLGDSALQVALGETPDAACFDRVQAFARALRELALPGITDIVPAYCTVTVHYDALRLPAVDDLPPMAVLTAAIEESLAVAARPSPAGRVIDLPVCYGGEFGPDLDWLAGEKQLSVEDVIARHCAPVYRVAMIGFAPGFCYLAGLDPQLAQPRRALPRARVPAGSVAIGGQQTGIYPADLPGGWHVIGRTPETLFDAAVAPHARLQAGDRVRFVPLPHAEWAHCRQQLDDQRRARASV